MDEALNIGFFAFHTLWIVFTSLGWIWTPALGEKLLKDFSWVPAT